MSANPPTGKELRLEMAKAIHRKNDLCVREGAEESWDSGYECTCFELADVALTLLTRIRDEARLEEAIDWNEMLKVQDLRAADEMWRKNRMYALEQSLARADSKETKQPGYTPLDERFED